MRAPDFIIAGTVAAGTGHLYGLLAQHPDVYLAPPLQPECNFFCKTRLYAAGLPHYLKTWFATAGRQQAVGERSSLLLSSDAAPARVAQHLPDVKLIFLVRNPVDRAYANYRFTALAGYEDLRFEDALRAEDGRVANAARDPFWADIQPHAYARRGLYADQLERWLAHVSPSRMLVMRSDELLRDEAAALGKVCRFLGVTERFAPEPCSDFSSPGLIDLDLQRRMRLEASAALDAAIQRLRDRQPPETDVDRRLRANVRDGYEPLDPEVRRRVTARFADANERLRGMVPFSIEDWM